MCARSVLDRMQAELEVGSGGCGELERVRWMSEVDELRIATHCSCSCAMRWTT